MQSLEKRIAALEATRGRGLKALTDEELEAHIAALTKMVNAEEAAQAGSPMELHLAER